MKILTRGLGLLLVFMLGFPFDGMAKEIKPGVTITKDNYREYITDLEKLLDPGSFQSVTRGLEQGVITMPIVETENYPQYAPLAAATKKNVGKCSVGKDNQLIGWKVGLPFPKPVTGAQLVWNLDRSHRVADQCYFVGNFDLLSKKAVIERKFQWNYWNYYYTGRVLVPPIPEVPDNNGVIRMKECFVMRNPFDVKGFSFIRTRYEDIYKADDVYSYIPAIRRMRRLTGSDVTDPMLGSDTIYDDFELFKQKINEKMNFSMGETRLLAPTIGPVENRPQRKSGFMQTTWQIRPIYVLDINIEDPEYIYSKRVLYLEKQRLTGGGYYLNTFDRQGRLYRGQMYWASWVRPPLYLPDVWGARYDNYLSGHHTHLEGFFKQAAPECKQEVFSFRYLLKRSR